MLRSSSTANPRSRTDDVYGVLVSGPYASGYHGALCSTLPHWVHRKESLWQCKYNCNLNKQTAQAGSDVPPYLSSTAWGVLLIEFRQWHRFGFLITGMPYSGQHWTLNFYVSRKGKLGPSNVGSF